MSRLFDFPEVDPRVIFEPGADDEFQALTPGGDVLALNALHIEVLRQCDGHREISAIAKHCAEKFDQEISVEDVAAFLDSAKDSGMLSPRYTGPLDPRRASRRCRRILRRLTALGLPAPSTDPAIADLASRVLERLRARDGRGALAAAFALHEISGELPWVARLVQEVERLIEAPVMGEFNPLLITVPMANPASLLRSLERSFGWIFGKLGMAIWVVTVGAGTIALLEQPTPPVKMLLHWEVAALLYLVSVLAIFVHEMSHAFSCHHYGGRVEKMGVGLMYGFPMAYADITSSYLFKDKWKRLLAPAAGCMGTAFCIGVASLSAWLLPPENPLHTALLLMAATELLQITFNVVPLLKLDGYYFLTELVGISNLRARSFEYLEMTLRHWVLGEGEPPEASPYEARIFLLYSLPAVAFSVWTLCAWPRYAYDYLLPNWRGWGLAALVLILFLLVGTPLRRASAGLMAFLRENRGRLLHSRAGLRLAAPPAILLAALLLIRTAETSAASFSLVPAQRAEVRAAEEGLVLSVLVGGGARVTKGQVLARLDNLDLKRRKVDAEEQVALARARLDRLETGARLQERELAAAAVETAHSSWVAAASSARRSSRLSAAGLQSQGDSEGAQAQLAAAHGMLETAEESRRLLAAGSRAEELAAARAQLEGAQAEAASALTALEQLTLRSPMDGIVADPLPQEQVGRLLHPGDSLLAVESGRSFVAELVPDWIPPENRVVGGRVKLLLPFGERVISRIARVRQTANASQALVLETEAFTASKPYAGLAGEARIYGAPASLAVEYLVHPIERFVGGDLWSQL